MICVIVKLLSVVLLLTEFAPQTDGNSIMPMIDFRYFRCVMKREWKCPDSEINFYLYTPEHPFNQWIDVRRPKKLSAYGWKLNRKNVLIIHGFNGTHSKTPMTFLRDAYLSRKDYNVFMVDWSPLTRFPCYLSALSNTKLAAQCTAQLYSRITQAGALAKKITCVGHSLGAHVCGMMSNHLTEKQYKIVGLDPARPLVSMYGSRLFRLGRDDAYVVQVIHTNAGFLGESGLVGHADFCVNGGRLQPGCKGHVMHRACFQGGPIVTMLGSDDDILGKLKELFKFWRHAYSDFGFYLGIGVARCSHFMSSCYFAAAVRRRIKMVGVPCDSACPKQGHSLLLHDRRVVKINEDTPESSRGMYCVKIDQQENCPFD